MDGKREGPMHAIPKAQTPTIEDSPDCPEESEWRDERSKLRGLKYAAFQALENVFGDKAILIRGQANSEVIDKLHEIGFPHERVTQYAAYLILVGGDEPYSNNPKIDLPGKYAISNYWLGVIDKYGGQIPETMPEFVGKKAEDNFYQDIIDKLPIKVDLDKTKK